MRSPKLLKNIGDPHKKKTIVHMQNTQTEKVTISCKWKFISMNAIVRKSADTMKLIDMKSHFVI